MQDIAVKSVKGRTGEHTKAPAGRPDVSSLELTKKTYRTATTNEHLATLFWRLTVLTSTNANVHTNKARFELLLLYLAQHVEEEILVADKEKYLDLLCCLGAYIWFVAMTTHEHAFPSCTERERCAPS